VNNLLSTRSDLKQILAMLGGCGQVVENFGRLRKIKLDFFRSYWAPGNKFALPLHVCEKVVDNCLEHTYNTHIN